MALPAGRKKWHNDSASDEEESETYRKSSKPTKRAISEDEASESSDQPSGEQSEHSIEAGDSSGGEGSGSGSESGSDDENVSDEDRQESFSESGSDSPRRKRRSSGRTSQNKSYPARSQRIQRSPAAQGTRSLRSREKPDNRPGKDPQHTNDSSPKKNKPAAPEKLQGPSGRAPRIELFALNTEYGQNDVCRLCQGPDPDSDNNNEILYCDGCDMAVHQICYDVAEVPEGDWFCRPCVAKREPNTDASSAPFIPRKLEGHEQIFANPDFSVIYDFLYQYAAVPLKVKRPSLQELAEALTTEGHSQTLADLFLKLLHRHGKMHANKDTWERVLFRLLIEGGELEANEESHASDSEESESEGSPKANGNKKHIKRPRVVISVSSTSLVAWGSTDIAQQPEDFSMEDLPCDVKTSILRWLLESLLIWSPVMDKYLREEAGEDMRTDPIGLDSKKNKYWLVEDDEALLVCRSDASGRWEFCCDSLEQLSALGQSFYNSKSPQELQIWRAITHQILPYFDKKAKQRLRDAEKQRRAAFRLANNGLDLSAVLYDRPRRSVKTVDYTYKEYDENIKDTLRSMNRKGQQEENAEESHRSGSKRRRMESPPRDNRLSVGRRTRGRATHSEEDHSDREEEREFAYQPRKREKTGEEAQGLLHDNDPKDIEVEPKNGEAPKSQISMKEAIEGKVEETPKHEEKKEAMKLLTPQTSASSRATQSKLSQSTEPSGSQSFADSYTTTSVDVIDGEEILSNARSNDHQLMGQTVSKGSVMSEKESMTTSSPLPIQIKDKTLPTSHEYIVEPSRGSNVIGGATFVPPRQEEESNRPSSQEKKSAISFLLL